MTQRLDQIAVELNQLSDCLNKRIGAWAARIKALNLGVEAHVELEGAPVSVLGYGRAEHGRWCLWVSHVRASERVPLIEAPRRTRMAALAGEAALDDALAKEAADLVEKLRGLS